MFKIRLDTLVTLVDASMFLSLFGSDDDISSHSALAISTDDSEGAQRMEEEGNGMRKVTGDVLI